MYFSFLFFGLVDPKMGRPMHEISIGLWGVWCCVVIILQFGISVGFVIIFNMSVTSFFRLKCNKIKNIFVYLQKF